MVLKLINTSAFNSITADGSNALTVDTDVKRNGLYSVKTVFDGTNENNRVNKNITTSDDVYSRMYFYLDTSFDLATTSQRFDFLTIRQDTTTTRARASLVKNASNQYALQASVVTPTANTFYSGSFGEIVKNTWYSVELRYRGNSTTGGAEVWLNNVSRGSIYTQNTTGLTVGRVEIGAQSSGIAIPTNGSTMYIDNVKIDTSRINNFSALGPAGTYLTTTPSWTTRQVYANNTTLELGASATTLADNQFFQDVATDDVYVRLTGSSNPNNQTIQSSRRQYVMFASGRNYIIYDGLITENNNTGSSAGFFFTNGDNNIVRNVIGRRNFGSGILFSTDSDNNLIEDSSFPDNSRDFGGGIRVETNSDNNIIENNQVSGLGGNGINIRGGNGPVTGTIIRNNLLYDLFDSGIYLHGINSINAVSNSQIYGNLIYNVNEIVLPGVIAGGNGIHLGVGPSNNLIYNNIIYDVKSHGISLREGANNNQIYNNTIYNVGLKGSGSGLNVFSSSTIGSSGNILRNNLVHSATTVPVNVDTASVNAGGNVLNNNLYYNPGDDVGTWAGVTYSTLSAYRTGSGQEANSINANPNFTNIAAQNFTLLATSPAINAGATIGAVTVDYVNQARPSGASYDIGAYEYVQTGSTGSLTLNAPASVSFTAINTSSVQATETVTLNLSNIIVEDTRSNAPGWLLRCTVGNFSAIPNALNVITLASATSGGQSRLTLTPSALNTISGSSANLTDFTTAQNTTTLTNLTSMGVSNNFTLVSFPSGSGIGRYSKNIALALTVNVPAYTTAMRYNTTVACQAV